MDGKIIFLNGASSAGKSSIARALQAVMEEPCFHLCIDEYLAAYQDGLWEREDIVRRTWPRIIRGFHAAGAAVARAGNLVIVDDVLESDPPWVESVLSLFEGLEVIFVGIHCPVEELERRERNRGNRKEGMARKQVEEVHAQAIYDLELDTSSLSPEEGAAEILSFLQSKEPATAFKELREMVGPPEG